MKLAWFAALLASMLVLSPRSVLAQKVDEAPRAYLKQLMAKQKAMEAAGASEEDLAAMRERVEDARRKAESDGGGPAGGESPAARAKHFRAAADHLRQAGAHDLAGQLLMKADALDRMDGEAKKPGPGKVKDGGKGADKGADASARIDKLHFQMERMRDELAELARNLKELRAQRDDSGKAAAK